MHKITQLLHHNSANAANTGFSSTGAGFNPYAKYGSYAPSSVLNWQQGQPIPQGWRLGNSGFLRPIYTLPPNLQGWQQGQSIPEGYRLGKRGTLKPLTYSWLSSSSFLQQQSSVMQATQVFQTAPVIEHREKAAVVQEVIKPGVREEIQPVIHREREQLEIREALQPVYEKNVRPTIVEERQLAAEIKPEVRLGTAPVIAPGPQSSVLVEAEHREVLMHAPVVEETVHKKIIEEVQPVIHREVIAPKVIHEVKPIYEKIVEAPVVTYSTLPARYEAAPVVAPAPALDVTTVTTTTTETEFIPANTSAGLLQKGMQTMNLGGQQTSTGFTPTPYTRQ